MNPHNQSGNRKDEVAAILRLLNRSTQQLDERTAERLHEARSVALKRHRAYAEAPAFAWFGLPGRWHGGISSGVKRQLYLATLIVAAITVFSCTAYWNHNEDHSDIDLAILTDDLPIEVFVD